jgi:hypothetical protein
MNKGFCTHVWKDGFGARFPKTDDYESALFYVAGPKVPEAAKSHHPTPGSHPGLQAGRLSQKNEFFCWRLEGQ